MAEPHHTDDPAAVTDRAIATRAVADDMSAIFGSAARDGAGTTTLPDASVQRRGRVPKLAIAVLVVSGLAAVVGAGLLAGGSVVSLPARASIEKSAIVKPPAGVAPPSFAVAGPAMPAPAPVAAPAAPPAPAPFASRLDRNHHVAANPETVATMPVPSRPAIGQFAMVGSSKLGCDDADACLDEQLEVAERDMADAFAGATDAGVREHLLRGYRKEWLRTRDEAEGRPHEALRIYAMMTSDLHNLSDDAAAARRPAWR